jgi:hypothetical protein
VKNAAPIFKRAKDARHGAAALDREPSATAFVTWEDGARTTTSIFAVADFQEWRKLVGHCFASPPRSSHTAQAVNGF